MASFSCAALTVGLAVADPVDALNARILASSAAFSD